MHPVDTLTPADLAAYEILVEHGAHSLSDLSSALSRRGFRKTPERLTRLPDVYPTHFTIGMDGRLSVANPHPTADVESGPQVLKLAMERVPAERVAVIDIETTGLDRHNDQLTEIAIVGLDGTVHLDVAVGLAGDLPPLDGSVPLAEALAALAATLANFSVIAGQNILAFDLPFLQRVAERNGIEPLQFPEAIDALDLSVLVDVELPERSLAGLVAHLGLANEAPHRARADASATADVLRALLGRVDPEDLSWHIVITILEQHGHPLAKLLPPTGDTWAGSSMAEAIALLERPPDDLLEPQQSSKPIDAWSSTRDGFRHLEALDAFRRRPMQVEMARAVATCLDHGSRLAVEAPTGTGKTFAYLLPATGAAASAGEPVVIATATKALQQQLRGDAARLAAEGLLNGPFRQVQGVNNYVCARELVDALDDTTPSPLALAVAARALATASNGTWDDITDQVLRSRDLNYVRTVGQLRTTSSGCDRTRCAVAHVCPLMRSLSGMDRNPGVVAVNHALLASWVKLRRDGMRAPGDVMEPGRAHLILDEAHQVEDTFTVAWTDELDGLELDLLATAGGRRSRLIRRVSKKGLGPDGLEAVEAIDQAANSLREAATALRGAIDIYLHEYAGSRVSVVLASGLVASRPEFRRLSQQATVARARLIAFGVRVRALAALVEGDPSLRRRLVALNERVDHAAEMLASIRELPESHRWVHQLERSTDGAEWRYARIPIHIFPDFEDEVVRNAKSTTLCSATLTVEQRFDFLAGRLGIQVTDEGVDGSFRGLRLPSPFNYAAQSLVVLTSHLPVPIPSNEREFCEEMAADQIGFLSLSGGRALALFAARTRMQMIADQVRERADELAERGVDLLVQGELGRAQILRRFRNELGTVLYGLRTYWEGFDAPGETLSYLFIEKPPYPHPDDALVAARRRAIADRGGDPFTDYVLPMTAMTFVQGFGRLIRNEADRGAAIICDRRIHAPGIARRVLLGSLPDPAIHESRDRDDAWSTAIKFVTGTAPDLSRALASDLDEVGRLLESLRVLPGEDPRPKLIQAATEVFGIAELAPEQLALMEALLDGRDVVGVLPTGFGKSLCFQLPALLSAENRAVVVVSPLVALINDQVNDLRGHRGIRSVQGITGSTSGVARSEILRDVAAGRTRLLYLSPERLARDPVVTEALARQQLNAVIVDEAHCVSVWGHDFRPEFRQIPKAVERFIRAPRGALTATATAAVEQDVRTALDMVDPLVVRVPAERPNLRYWVVGCPDERTRARELLRFVTSIGDSPGIVYVTRRALAEEIASLLRWAGVRARPYHAGLLPEQRLAAQEDFDSDTTQVIVATKAFGMGINKPNIGWVLHFDVPESLDGYAQESGRAARRRDLIGDCVLLCTKADLARQRRLATFRPGDDEHDARRLLDALWQSPIRGDDRVFESDALAEALEIDEERLNVLLALLEQCGALTRCIDCSLRGTVAVGANEPADEADRTLFRRLTHAVLRVKPHVRTQLDFAKLETEHGFNADQLEKKLLEWELDRLVSFSSSRRARRVHLVERDVAGGTIRAHVRRWVDWQRHRVDAICEYADNRTVCRRVVIARHFGDQVAPCGPSHPAACDVCSGGTRPWLSVPDHLVPDPEAIDVELTVSNAVAWASQFRAGSYGEAGLKAAVLGQETFGTGRPLGAGLMNCPQFGALRHVRNAPKRWDGAVADLIDRDLIERAQVARDARTCSTLRLTPDGRRALGLPGEPPT